MRSPWQVALGPEIGGLATELTAYFAAIPPDSVGRGAGTFDVVGTPRRWLWPVLRLVGGGDLFPVWAHDVPFEVVNRAAPARAAVRAERRVHLPSSTRVMRDEIASTAPEVVVDRIGAPPRIAAEFRADVVEGALRLVSTRVGVRFGPLRVALGRLAPGITLVERFDAEVGRQHVALEVDSRLLGRLYEYRGHFTYRIEQEEAG